MEEKNVLNKEEIDRVIKVVERITNTTINWKFERLTGGRIVCFMHRGNNEKSVKFRVANSEYHHTLRNNILMKYAKQIEIEMAEE